MVSISEVDLADGRTFHEWYEAVREVWLEAWPGDPPWAAEAETRELYMDEEEDRRILLVGREATGEVAGVARIGLPQKENRHVADVEVAVRAPFRKRGIGRSLLEAAEACAAANGRTVYHSDTSGEKATLQSREAHFAAAAGFQVARIEVRRDLRLPLDPGLADELEVTNGPAAAGYELVSWWHRCPDELVESRARLAWTLAADEPRGELDVEDEQYDVDRIRWWEQKVATTGRALVCTGAVHEASGELAAVTELGMPRQDEDLAMQFTTVVGREHRGHRLGILVKLANLKLVADHANAPRRVCTWNAESNGPMIRVNDALGFEVVGRAFNWQKTAT